MRSGWSTRKITAVLYPFGAGAMALNVFFASMIGSAIGLPILTPIGATGLGALLGLPATWLFARHIRHLIDIADGSSN
jgi:hypothetical protein